jgi:hypothetical protein
VVPGPPRRPCRGGGRDPAYRRLCGYAVPLYDYAGERDLLDRWTADKDDTALAVYRARRNRQSLDDLPALPMTAGDRQAGWAESGLTSSGLQEACSLEAVERS